MAKGHASATEHLGHPPPNTSSLVMQKRAPIGVKVLVLIDGVTTNKWQRWWHHITPEILESPRYAPRYATLKLRGAVVAEPAPQILKARVQL